MMHPVELQRSLANHGRHRERHIPPRKAVVRAGPKDEPVLRLRLCVARDPPLWVEDVRVRVRRRVVQGGIARGDDHGVLGHGVVWRHGEGLEGEVGYEDDGRAVAEEFFDYGVGVGEGFEHLELKGAVLVAASGSQVFGSETIQDVWSLSQDLEEPCRGTAGSVLGGEEEGEERLGNLLVGELPDEVRRLLKPLDTRSDGFVISLGLKHVLHPLVDDAGRLSARGHIHLAGGGTLCELRQNGVRRALSPPALGKGDVDGQRDVDKLERIGDEVEVVRDPLNGLLGDVIAKEGAARQRAVDLPEPAHKLCGLSPVCLAVLDKSVEVVRVDLFLDGQIGAQGLVREEPGQASAKLGVRFTVEEDPCRGAHDVNCHRDEAWSNKGWGLEDFVRQVAV